MAKFMTSLVLLFCYSGFLKEDFIYLFMRDTEREAETQAEGEAGSMQGAQRGTQSQDSRIMPEAKGRHSSFESPRHLKTLILIIFF